MHNYTKIIIDTSNIFYRVAAFHLKDLNEENYNTLIKNNTVVNYYKTIVNKFAQSTLGEVCLLFDPLESNGQMSTRLQIKENYKSNRDKKNPISKLKQDVLEKLYSYFLIESSKKISIYHDFCYEADDFVEKLTMTGKCLMVTSDEDFCRYLENGRVDMLYKGLTLSDENIFTASDFEKKYGFIPNVPSVTFWKVMYGDKSDNVIGAFQNENTKILDLADNYMKQLLVDMGQKNPSIERMKRELFSGTGDFAKLKELLLYSNTTTSYEKLLNLMDSNFKVIESYIPRNSDIDINKFKIKIDIKKTDVKKKFSLKRVHRI